MAVVADLDRRVRTVLRSLEHLAVDPDQLAETEDLYRCGLKSLTAVQLMLGLEREFGIEFPESMLHRSALSTVAGIRAAVATLAGEAAPPARGALAELHR